MSYQLFLIDPFLLSNGLSLISGYTFQVKTTKEKNLNMLELRCTQLSLHLGWNLVDLHFDNTRGVDPDMNLLTYCSPPSYEMYLHIIISNQPFWL